MKLGSVYGVLRNTHLDLPIPLIHGFSRYITAMHRHQNQPFTTEVSSRSVFYYADRSSRQWIKRKTDGYITTAGDLLVEIKDPLRLSSTEEQQLRQHLATNNFVFYQYRPDAHYSASGYQHICARLGLVNTVSNPVADANDISRIQVRDNSHDKEYIPYTDRALKWHTDGYYNTANNQVNAFVLHCIRNAQSGGSNSFLDHELAYLLLLQQNPRWVDALSSRDVMTIPANMSGATTIRTAYSGPVFDFSGKKPSIYMRFTERQHNIVWKDDDEVQDALSALRKILHQDNPWKIEILLEPGQGVISNNVLHRRDAFQDNHHAESKRCLDRIRFHDRVEENMAVSI